MRHASDIRRRIADLHAYAGLQSGLEPGEGGTRNPEIRNVLNAVGEFLREGSDADISSRGPALESLLAKATTIHPRLRAKQAPAQIGRDFINLGAERDIWRYGLTYGWLLERFETPILALPLDLPVHARIGLGHHAGAVAIEEVTLLDDAFVLLAQTRIAYDHMMRKGDRTDEPQSVPEAQTIHRILTQLNMNVATFARLAVVTIAAFVESFVNSVGANEVWHRVNLSSDVAEQLNGTRKGRYLSLEFKMERFPALIRADGNSPLRVIDDKQRIEPFRRFLAETKVVRDAAMHFAPAKEPIICTPQEWLQRANNAVIDAVGVAQAFWSACYPNAAPPAYLYGLDDKNFMNRAESRVAAMEFAGKDDDRPPNSR